MKLGWTAKKSSNQPKTIKNSKKQQTTDQNKQNTSNSTKNHEKQRSTALGVRKIGVDDHRRLMDVQRTLDARPLSLARSLLKLTTFAKE